MKENNKNIFFGKRAKNPLTSARHKINLLYISLFFESGVHHYVNFFKELFKVLLGTQNHCYISDFALLCMY